MIDKSDYFEMTDKMIDTFSVVSETDIEKAKLLVSSASELLARILDAEVVEDLNA